jgi:hypothetical protein
MKALRAEGLGFDRIAAHLNADQIPTREIVARSGGQPYLDGQPAG